MQEFEIQKYMVEPTEVTKASSLRRAELRHNLSNYLVYAYYVTKNRDIYSPFTMKYDFRFQIHRKYQILFTTHTTRTVQYEKLTLIWNSMRVINISPTARFQETNQWNNRPSYRGGTYMYQWDLMVQQRERERERIPLYQNQSSPHEWFT